MADFEIVSDFNPSGDQPRAINELVDGINSNIKHQTLLGVTGSGKTYTIAKVIEKVQRPTLVISHNKTLAAQLYGEFKSLFPNNAVEYFISYYDYYQPESYMPVTDTFIEKDFSMDEEIDRLRLKATSSLVERSDVIVVSSVSCIYGLGSPEEYKNQIISLKKGENINRRQLTESLVDIYYQRNDQVLERCNFRIMGDIFEIFPAYEQNAIRVDIFDNNRTDQFKIWEDIGEKLDEFNTKSFTGTLEDTYNRNKLYFDEITNYEKKEIPATFYIHSWELTPELMPRIKLSKKDNFITYHNIEKAYEWADLLIGRAGAMTVSESSAIGLPSILIPFPHAMDNHQWFNAQFLAKKGGAKVILDKDLTPEILSKAIKEIFLKEGKLSEMAEAAFDETFLNATQNVAKFCYEKIGHNFSC